MNDRIAYEDMESFRTVSLSVLVGVHEALYHCLAASVKRSCQEGLTGDVVTSRDWVTAVVFDIDGLAHHQS